MHTEYSAQYQAPKKRAGSMKAHTILGPDWAAWNTSQVYLRHSLAPTYNRCLSNRTNACVECTAEEWQPAGGPRMLSWTMEGVQQWNGNEAGPRLLVKSQVARIEDGWEGQIREGGGRLLQPSRRVTAWMTMGVPRLQGKGQTAKISQG